ncbi:hypothetical protein [Comamonas antarctica]|uniref:Uncharacterized protein n=1 Tax=Comamonas antarctica TaxID=2743470 RepID=A0A6N1WZ53_9BURK|nr:hypothetical protein [Comamonas antarctica]QKV52371.1 hypothetical protein HUK68_05310 [Comamonas antarctica]
MTTTETPDSTGCATRQLTIPRRYGRKLLGAFFEHLVEGREPHESDLLYYVPVGVQIKGVAGISSVGVRSGVTRGDTQCKPSITVIVVRVDGYGFPVELTPMQALVMAERLKLAARDAVRAANTFDSYARTHCGEEASK